MGADLPAEPDRPRDDESADRDERRRDERDAGVVAVQVVDTEEDEQQAHRRQDEPRTATDGAAPERPGQQDRARSDRGDTRSLVDDDHHADPYEKRSPDDRSDPPLVHQLKPKLEAVIDRNELRVHLLATGLSGDTATPRSNAVRHAELLAADDPDKHLGIGRRGRDLQGVMDAVAALCLCSNDPDDLEGPGYIAHDRTLDELDTMAARLAKAASNRERVLVVTGHPTALPPWYARIARALDRNGAYLLAPLEDVHLEAPAGMKTDRGSKLWRYFDEVGVLSIGWRLVHTHESWPMDLLLDEVTPDLVLADHGFAGAAAARGIPTIAVTDVNDPAIAVGWQDGLFEAAVPLDDNRPPRHYLKLATWCVDAIDASR